MKSPVLLTRFEFLGGVLAAAAAPHALADKSANDVSINRLKTFEIVIPDNASEAEQHAAQVLQEHVGKLTGTETSVRKEASYGHTPAIFVGRTRAAGQASTTP